MRKAVAVAALLALGGLVVVLSPRTALDGYGRFELAVTALLVPLVIAVAGIVLETFWARWLALAIGVAVLPWGLVLTVVPLGMPRLRQAVALGAALLLLLSLAGRTMMARYEGRSETTDWSGRRMAVVRWTIICNIASILFLYLFTAVYDYRVDWVLAVPAALMFGMIGGVVLLARGKTLGLLALAVCCLLLVPAGTYFVWTEANHLGEVFLFALSFLPGILTGLASLVVFGGPMWRFLRAA
jgi:hypothetical protein